MNFFGHAVVATWRSDSSGFVLGAMLPDFATMLGTRPPEVSDANLTEGVAFHHATDAVFHDAPTFKRLQLEARKTLREMGLARASSLAVGHIGVEILLDATLAEDTVGVSGYLAALEQAHELGHRIAWSDDDLRERFGTLSSVLSNRGVTPSSRTAEAAAFRITRALAPRPRLCLSPDGERIVRSWAETAGSLVEASAGALIAEIRAGLQLYPQRRP